MFSGFQFLVQLLGNNLVVDELPGGAVVVDEFEDYGATGSFDDIVTSSRKRKYTVICSIEETNFLA